MKLGRVNVRQMLSEITYPEWIEWQVFAQLEVFEEERGDRRAALLASILVNLKRDPKTDAYTLQDFMLCHGDTPTPKKAAKTQTWRVQKAVMEGFFPKEQKPRVKRTPRVTNRTEG